MLSLLQTAALSPAPCGTPLALLRVAGPHLGLRRRDVRMQPVLSSTLAKSRSFSRSCSGLSAGPLRAVYRGSKSKSQVAQIQSAPPRQASLIGSILPSGTSTSNRKHLHTAYHHRPSSTGITRPRRDNLQLSTITSSSHCTALRPQVSDSPQALSADRKNLTAGQSRLYATAGNAEMYTASFAFFEAIWEAGVTHCFVNLGSDHPSIIEAMVKGQREKNGQFPRIITCPNEVYPHSPV